MKKGIKYCNKLIEKKFGIKHLLKDPQVVNKNDIAWAKKKN